MQLMESLSKSGIAYLDGGSGSMLLQAALAGILAGAYSLKSVYFNLRARVLGAKNTSSNPKA